MPTAKLAIVSNHMSTRNQPDASWHDAVLAGERDIHREVIERPGDVPAILAACAAAGVDTIAVDGGDGTAGLVFSALLNQRPYTTPPVLALLPSGKTNMTAEAWSLRGPRAEALADLVRRHRDGSLVNYVTTQEILGVQAGPDAAPGYGAFFGAADVVEGIRYCRRAIYPLGLPNALSHSAAISVLLWRALAGSRNGGDLSATWDDGVVGENGRFFVVIATTMEKLLLGLEPVPAEGNGPVRYVSLRAGPAPVLRALPGLMRRRIGGSNSGPGCTARLCGKVKLAFNGFYTVDGELYEAAADTPLILDGSQTLRFARW